MTRFKIPSPSPATALVQPELKTPLYHQIFLILRAKIERGDYEDGAMLPGELEISDTYGVSRITAKRALNDLAVAGFAIRGRGKGTRVRRKGGATVLSGSVESLKSSLRATPDRPKVLEFDYVVAPAEALRALEIPPGTIVQRAIRILEVGGRPYAHLTTFVPALVGKAWGAEDLSKKPLVKLFDAAGIVIDRAQQTITATLADNQLASALKVGMGEPLLRVVRTMYATGGEPVEYLIAHHPPTRYQFDMSLTGSTVATTLM